VVVDATKLVTEVEVGFFCGGCATLVEVDLVDGVNSRAISTVKAGFVGDLVVVDARVTSMRLSVGFFWLSELSGLAGPAQVNWPNCPAFRDVD